jgi:hypothetical protein
MAEENRDWGYRRIQGALSNLGYGLARSMVAQILERHGIEPVPERSRKTFLEGVSDATLGTDGGCGLLHRGSVDPAGAAALHRAVLYRVVDAQSGDCGHRGHHDRRI